MYPVLFSLGKLSISSFGVFLSLGLVSAAYICWKLGKIYDVNEEKILDLIILTFAGGLIGARIFFVATNWPAFGDFYKVLMVNMYPGLSFWGGLFFGVIILRLLANRFKLNFWQVVDFAAVAYLLGLVFGDMGCFLGGCAPGAVSNSFLATPVVGLIGKRFPVSAIESLLLLTLFFYLWKQTIRFHFGGKIAATFLFYLGIIKFMTEFFRGDSRLILPSFWLAYGHLFSLMLAISGGVIFYTRSKRSITCDLKYLFDLPFSAKKRQSLLLQFKKSCYNHRVNLKILAGDLVNLTKSTPKIFRRRFNVKPTPKNFR